MERLEADPAPGLYRLRGRSDGKPVAFELPVGVHRVGSRRGSEVLLAERGISRAHAVITVTERGLVVEDLGSKNGTFVNGAQVGRAALDGEGRVAFGPVELCVERLAPEAALAIRFAVNAASSESWTVERGDGCWPDTATHNGGEPGASDAETGRWCAAAGDLARRLGEEAPELAPAVAALGRGLGLGGVVLVRWDRQAAPHALAAWGALGDLPPLALLRALPSEGDSGVDRRSGFFPADPPVSVAVRCEDGRPAIGLVGWGEFAARRSAGPFLRLVLELLEVLQARGLGAVRRPARASDALVFPPSYVPGSSAAMAEVYSLMRVLRSARRPVLVHGETGVGKEALAWALHASSPRARGPFVVVNCAAIPESLLEAEMFGVTRGAATGIASREGYFGQAEGGTLFLDEIGELGPGLQAKLLRALQEREIQPVGGRPRPVDVWVIAATHADVDRGATRVLRRDLYYRLAAGRLEVPPLRACREDVPLLVTTLLRRFADDEGVALRGVTARALERLCAYDWPGNVRELEHEMHALARRREHGGVIDLEHLPERLRRPAAVDDAEAAEAEGSLALKPQVEALERRLIRAAMRRTGGRQTEAAKLLGLSRNGLAKMLQRLGLRDAWLEPPDASRTPA